VVTNCQAIEPEAKINVAEAIVYNNTADDLTVLGFVDIFTD